ncbi:MAG TPA: NAD(P)/FAD-dependent oxidoreductase [Solirubrobacteraceae bacterium]|jgi:2-polyprenyl-6-methoxyphenol hydroxylase-like FAD-dependent oxidoreductase|nr:NAD(P)/FAD-dependent oxidoreductase [Solirubrobacteraceae bacterium]
MSGGASPERYDVAIVGASTAGCTAARLFAERGASVALIEKRPAMDAYKTVCTHFLQASAVPTIEKLGLAPLIEQQGAIANDVDVWTRGSGWIHTDGAAGHGYNITRRKLDPILRELAAGTPGVELISGWTATGLLGEGRPRGVRIEDRRHERRELQAKLVVAADGRDSGVARWAHVPGRVKPHGRFFYWSYWRGIRPRTTRSRMWLLDPDAAYTFPNEDDLTVVLLAPHRDRLPEFQADLQGAYRRMVNSLPDGPDLSEATLESKLLGKLELPNVFRPAGRPGLAFVGDAALAGDPLWGIGCGWAFQSADWLVQETADWLRDPSALDAALERYRKLHRKRLLPHYLTISDLASGRPINPIERRLFRAAATDRVVRGAFEQVGTRTRPPSSMLKPRILARIARAQASPTG